jgi:hypothetical protein
LNAQPSPGLSGSGGTPNSPASRAQTAGSPPPEPERLGQRPVAKVPTTLEIGLQSVSGQVASPSLGAAEIPRGNSMLPSMGLQGVSGHGASPSFGATEMPGGTPASLAKGNRDDSTQVVGDMRPVFRVARRPATTQAEVQSTAPAIEDAAHVPDVAPRVTFSMRRAVATARLDEQTTIAKVPTTLEMAISSRVPATFDATTAAKVPATLDPAMPGPLGRFMNYSNTGLDADVPPTFEPAPLGIARPDTDVPPTLDQVPLVGRSVTRTTEQPDDKMPGLSALDADVPPTLEQAPLMARFANRAHGTPEAKVPTTFEAPIDSNAPTTLEFAISSKVPATFDATTTSNHRRLVFDTPAATTSAPVPVEAPIVPRPTLVFADRVVQATAPVWNEAHRITHDALTVERADASSAAPPAPNAVNNTFNVNVHVGPDGVSASQDREALEQALCDILRDAARRHGLEV